MTSPIDRPRLGDVAEFIRGITFKPEDVVPTGTPGSVPCMRTKNVQAELDLSDVWSVDSRFARRPGQYLETGDVLVSSANSWNLVGKCCWVPEVANGSTFGGFIAALRPNRQQVHPRYLFHWFSSSQIQATVRSFGRQTTNISNLDLTRCLNLPVPLPPLDEQQRIVLVLDGVNELRIKRKKAIALLDNLAESIFLNMFGDPGSNPLQWPERSLETLISIGPQNGIYKPSSSYGAGVPIVRIDSFYAGEITKIAALKRVSITEEEAARYRLKPGDVIINRVNSLEYLGKCALVPKLSENTVYESNIMRFAVDRRRANPRFISALLQDRHIRRQILAAAKKAVNQASINQSDVRSLQIYTPPVTLQNIFSEQIDATRILRARHSAHLLKLDALFASVQHRAFRGELWGTRAA